MTAWRRTNAPKSTLRGAREVEIHDAPGDVIVFPGSSVWHLRRRSALTANVYLKFNDFDSDPLGEDHRTAERRAQSLSLLEEQDRLRMSVPRLSRRFDSVSREHSRLGWQETLWAHVWGQPPVVIPPAHFDVLRTVDSGRNFEQIVKEGPHGQSPPAAEACIQHLVRQGVVDLT